MDERSMYRWIALFPVALVFYGIFLSQYIQEDAFIYFRTALNLAESGDYSFNYGEGYPAATSVIYSLIISFHVILFSDFFTLSLQFFNSAASVIGAYLLVSSFPGDFREEYEKVFLIFFIIFSPALMTLAVSGMETPFVFLFLSLMVYGYTKNWRMVFLAAVFLPLFRIEASVASIIICFVSAFSYKWRAFFSSLFGMIIGVLLFFAINHYFSGSFLPQTISAKDSAYEPSREFLGVAYRFYQTFFENSYLLGIKTKFIPGFVYVGIGLLMFFVFSWVLMAWVKNISRKENEVSEELSWLVVLVLISLSFPIGYSIGGVIFPWYLWPSSVVSYFIVGFLVLKVERKGWRQKIMASLLFLLLPISIASLMIITNYGYQESGFRASVGKFIKEKSSPGDTLFLEPAGYIPFYAELRTWDTVGLVSPEVLEYRSKENPDWWIEFVMDKNPTYIVERLPIHVSGYPDGTRSLGFTEEDRSWFSKNYEILEKFIYSDYLYESRGVMTPIYKLGGHSDYFVYRIKD